jgi:hypothetical protein
LERESFFVEVCADPVAFAQVLKEKVFCLAGCVSIYVMSEFGHHYYTSSVDVCALNFPLK